MQQRTLQTRRRGTVLVLFAGLAFAFLALAALAVDMGFALLAQRQMNTATDMAALEGLRNRDDTSRDWRAEAQQMASQLDSFQDASGGVQRYGTGPTVDFSGGIAITGSSFRPAQSYQPGSSGSLASQLEKNAANVLSGDMVSGTHQLNQSHAENPDYTRADFTADAAGTAQAGAGNAFLVRMRRTGETPSAGETSAGPTVPYLFGLGSLLGSEAKAKGIPVRATAIAEGRPALSVGLPSSASSLAGAAAYGLTLSFWNAMPDSPVGSGAGDQQVQLTISTNGSTNGQLTNRMVDPGGGWMMQVPTQGPLVIGDAFQTVDDDGSSPTEFQRYVPIYTPIGAQNTNVIFGFGYVEATRSGNTLSLVKRSKRIALHNASAVVVRNLNFPAALTAADKQSFFSMIPVTPSLATPALVR